MEMPSKITWRKVGKVKEAHGLRGDLYLLIFSKEAAWIDDLDFFLLSPSDDPSQGSEFEVQKAKLYKDGLIVKSIEVPDRTAAEKLKGQMLFVPEDLFQSEDDEVPYLLEIEGFTVSDFENQDIGVIVGFSSNNVQDLLVVKKTNGKKSEIPFVNDFVMKLDHQARRLQMNLPEGLLDFETL
jgi:16S rRNA processing protein RimM